MASNETNAGTLYAKATYNSDLAPSVLVSNASVTVKQGANSVVATAYTVLSITCDVEKIGVAASGGTVSPPSSSHITAKATGYVTYTSKATAYTETGPTVTVSWSGNTNIPAKPAQVSNETTASTLTGKAIWSGLTSNTISVEVIQAANRIESTTYTALTFSLVPPTAIAASGGSVASTTIVDGLLQGYSTYTSKATAATSTSTSVSNPTWGSASTETGTITWNKSVSADTRGTTTGYSRTVGYLCAKATISGASGEQRVVVEQEANRRSTSPTYTALTINLVQPADIPASGGIINSGKFSCQRNGYWSYTSNATAPTSTTVSSSSTSYSFNSVRGYDLEDSVQPRQEIGTLTVSVSYGGNSGSDSKPVYQQENAVVSTTTTTSSTSSFASSSVTNDNYNVSVNKTSISFTSSGASSTTITVIATHDRTTAITSNYYMVSATTTVYTSTYRDVISRTASTPYDTATDYTEPEPVNDTPTITNTNTWITATTTQIKVSAQSAGAAARRGTVTYRNSTATPATVSVSQVAGASIYWITVNGETSYEESLASGETTNVYIECGGGSTHWTASIPSLYSSRVSLSKSEGWSGDDVDVLCKTKITTPITITFTNVNATATLTITPTGT